MNWGTSVTKYVTWKKGVKSVSSPADREKRDAERNDKDILPAILSTVCTVYVSIEEYHI